MQTLCSIMKQLQKNKVVCPPFHILTLIISCFTLLACSEDTPYPSAVTSFVDAITDDNGMITDIRTDKEEVYKIDSQIHTNTPDTVIRCICIYEIMQRDVSGNNHTPTYPSVHIHSLKHVFSDEPRLRSEFNLYPQDPVKITSVWKAGNYINMHLGILTTDAGIHSFAFCEDSITTSDSGCTSVYLSLLHLRPKNDAESYTEKTYISMPIRKYADIDTIIVHINSYEGLQEFVYQD